MIKNDAGEVTELVCSFDPDTRSGTGSSERKVKGTIHWVSAAHACETEVRLYDRLFKVPDPEGVAHLNPDSVQTVNAKLEPSLRSAKAEERFQFERHGYFVADRDGFNRTVTLRDSWNK